MTLLKPQFIMGKKPGLGSYDTYWNKEKYPTLQEAIDHNEVVVIDFVIKDKLIYFQLYNTTRPDSVKLMRLKCQNFIPSLGIDTRDDWEMEEIAISLL